MCFHEELTREWRDTLLLSSVIGSFCTSPSWLLNAQRAYHISEPCNVMTADRNTFLGTLLLGRFQPLAVQRALGTAGFKDASHLADFFKKWHGGY